VIIDCHGHYTTAPPAHTDWRVSQLAAFREGGRSPAYPAISERSPATKPPPWIHTIAGVRPEVGAAGR